jgi:hypothetical protein
MIFDIMRTSDIRAGRVGLNAPQPIPSARADHAENRWVADIASIEQLMSIDEQLRILPPAGPEMGVIEIMDVLLDQEDS